jgi:hypothetical protein
VASEECGGALEDHEDGAAGCGLGELVRVAGGFGCLGCECLVSVTMGIVCGVGRLMSSEDAWIGSNDFELAALHGRCSQRLSIHSPSKLRSKEIRDAFFTS